MKAAQEMMMKRFYNAKRQADPDYNPGDKVYLSGADLVTTALQRNSRTNATAPSETRPTPGVAFLGSLAYHAAQPACTPSNCDPLMALMAQPPKKATPGVGLLSGPFIVVRKVGAISYELKLLESWKVHPVVNTVFLCPWVPPVAEHQHHDDPPPPNVVDGVDLYELAEVLKMCLKKRRKHLQYLIRTGIVSRCGSGLTLGFGGRTGLRPRRHIVPECARMVSSALATGRPA
ncbi:hypothetical protein B0H14DRAFT_3430714 [Mycena olivaceomarginata]|nr:hypothetical protein B0H14DRAFT_3430714 [Mycena olivaceomarginata]